MALDAFGTTLSRDTGDGVFEPIASVTALTPPGFSRETLDVTSHDSEDGWMEFLGGLKDPGEVSCDVNYDPVDHDKLIDGFDDDLPVDYEIAFPDGTVWSFGAILTGFEADAPYDDKLTASLTWKVTSRPSITSA